MSGTDSQQEQPNQITFWQLNVNKSAEAQLALLHNSGVWHAGDILAIQEPYLDFNNRMHVTPGWHMLYPSTHLLDGSDRSCSVLLVKTSISTNNWAQVAVPSLDVTVVRLHSAAGWILCINVYNP
jgi:hypothetical protein